MRTVRLLVIVALTGALLGCGQKGPLVLPEAQRPHRKIGVSKPSPSPAPASPAPAGPSQTPAPPPTDTTATGERGTAPAPQR